MSVEVDHLITDLARRDQWGRLIVVPPGGGKPVGYTRVTTIAKATDDGGLATWKAAMACAGLHLRGDLRAKWETLMATTGGDPWYHSGESKGKAKALISQLGEAGGDTVCHEQGIGLRAITALHDSGKEDLVGLTDNTWPLSRSTTAP